MYSIVFDIHYKTITRISLVDILPYKIITLLLIFPVLYITFP